MAKAKLNPIEKWEGKSLLVNALLIALNISGVVMVTLGQHKANEENETVLTLIGILLLLTSIGGLIMMKGRMILTSVSRVLVGGLFIVSGLVKANDPIGFSYKLEEYFEDGALAFRIKEWFGMPDFSLEFLIPYALTLSIVICVIEILVGVWTILGRLKKINASLLVGMMLFFTFLTWHTANCDGGMTFVDRDRYEMSDPVAQMKLDQAEANPEITIVESTVEYIIVDETKQPQCVDDCGCFGDALKGSVGRSLTPSESLWKDLILLYFSVWIFLSAFKRSRVNVLNNSRYIITALVVVTFLCFVFGWYFPLIFAVAALLGASYLASGPVRFVGQDLGAALWVIFLCVGMLVYVLMFAPIKDYRPYAVGSNLLERMNDGDPGKYVSLLQYKNTKTGEIKEYDAADPAYTASKIWEKSEWVYETMTQKELVPMRIPSITNQFNPYLSVDQLSKAEKDLPRVQEMLDANQIKAIRMKDVINDYELTVPLQDFLSEDYPVENYEYLDTIDMLSPDFSEVSLRDYVVSTDKIFLLISKQLDEASWEAIENIKEIHAAAKSKNIPFIVMTSSARGEMTDFRTVKQWDVPMFTNDETELKAISRSNPTLIYIEKGIVKAKYPFRSIPSSNWIENNLLQQ